MLPKKIHQFIYLLGSLLLVASLPVSFFLLSNAVILLTANWILEGGFRKKLKKLGQQKALLLLVSVYLVHLIWMFNTSELKWGLHDLRIKLPLLLLPLVYGTSLPFRWKEYKLILLVFIGMILISSFITSFILFGFSKIDPIDSREASIFISHIRFSLMVVFSIYILFYLLVFENSSLRPIEKYLYSLILIWLIIFLILLNSFTGIIIFVILLPLAIIWWSHHTGKSIFILSSYLLCSIIAAGIFFYLLNSVNQFNKLEHPDIKNLEEFTLNGNKYDHYPDHREYENGQLVWLYVAENELRESWNRVSTYKFDSVDRKGQAIRSTLVRYMTSMGLRKDSLAFSQLTQKDIAMIEKGYTNHIYKKKFSIYPRIYEILWEVKMYRLTRDPSGQSLGQRIEYLKIGTNIVKRSFWLGTGTGDVRKDFKKQYEIDQSLLKPEWRHRAHNQFLTFFISFGIFGAAWILFAMIAPVFLVRKHHYFLLTVFLILSLLSMLNEDTLETHVGVTFCAFFYAFLLFASPEKNSHAANED